MSSNNDIWDVPQTTEEEDRDVPRMLAARAATRRRRLLDPTAAPAPLPPPPPPAYPELTSLPSITSGTCRKIFALPVPVGASLDLRPGHPPLKNLGKGTYNLESALGQLRGASAPTPCTRCAREKGPYRSCKVIDGQFDSACCCCRYNNEGSACSFHRLYTNPTSPKTPKNSSVKPRPPPTPNSNTKRAKNVLKQLKKEKRKARISKGRAISDEEEDEEEEENEDEDEDEDSMVRSPEMGTFGSPAGGLLAAAAAVSAAGFAAAEPAEERPLVPFADLRGDDDFAKDDEDFSFLDI